MRITRIRLLNWRNFHEVDVRTGDRVFLVGANASGKSNFLDALRFLADIAVPGGGLATASAQRGGLSKIRCLAARRNPNVGIEVDMQMPGGDSWSYRLEFGQEQRGHRQVRVRKEIIEHDGKVIVQRPDGDDAKDPVRLSQTLLEQVLANHKFRIVVSALQSISYLHLVPQVVRGARELVVRGSSFQAYGHDFLERVATGPERTTQARLRRIGQVLQTVVPQLAELKLVTDDRGSPHLQANYKHWRAKDAYQTEDQFSDGTLRLIGLLWALQDGSGPLLMEEPELSLHDGIVRRIPSLMHRIHRVHKRASRQVFISTHSMALLSDEGIGADEVLTLAPATEGTNVVSGVDIPEIRALMDAGLPAGDAVIPYVEPPTAHQLVISFK